MPSAHYQKTTYKDLKNDFRSHQLGYFEEFYNNSSMKKIKELGLIII